VVCQLTVIGEESLRFSSPNKFNSIHRKNESVVPPDIMHKWLIGLNFIFSVHKPPAEKKEKNPLQDFPAFPCRQIKVFACERMVGRYSFK